MKQFLTPALAVLALGSVLSAQNPETQLRHQLSKSNVRSLTAPVFKPINTPQKDAGTVATFEDLALSPETYWTGDRIEGNDQTTYSLFYSGSYAFTNTWTEAWQAWSGFAYSNLTATDWTAHLFPDQYRSAVGHGANGSKNYAIAYVAPGFNYPQIRMPKRMKVPGMYIANEAWAKYTYEHGTGMGAEPNEPFHQGDYYIILAKGDNGEVVRIPMIDYRASNPKKWEAIDGWKWINLSDLGEVASITFDVEGSRDNGFGSTIPFYFALDDFGAEDPELATAELFATGSGLKDDPFILQVGETLSLSEDEVDALTLKALGRDPEVYVYVSSNHSALQDENGKYVYNGKDSAVKMTDKDLLGLDFTAIYAVEGLLHYTLHGELRKFEGSKLVGKKRQNVNIYFRVVEKPKVTATEGVHSSQLRLWPTTSSDVLHVSTAGELSIYNLAGVRIYHRSDYHQGEAIPVASWAAGMYLVKTPQGVARFVKR